MQEDNLDDQTLANIFKHGQVAIDVQSTSSGKKRFDVYPDYKMLLQNFNSADHANMSKICQKDIPTAKQLVLHQFHDVVAQQVQLRDQGTIFKSKKEFEDFMTICLRHYK